MKKSRNLVEKLLENPPNCKQCNTLMDFVKKGTVYSSQRFVGYVLMFRCPECKSITVKVVQIKIIARNFLRASLFLFETIY